MWATFVSTQAAHTKPATYGLGRKAHSPCRVSICKDCGVSVVSYRANSTTQWKSFKGFQHWKGRWKKHVRSRNEQLDRTCSSMDGIAARQCASCHCRIVLVRDVRGRNGSEDDRVSYLGCAPFIPFADLSGTDKFHVVTLFGDLWAVWLTLIEAGGFAEDRFSTLCAIMQYIIAEEFA